MSAPPGFPLVPKLLLGNALFARLCLALFIVMQEKWCAERTLQRLIGAGLSIDLLPILESLFEEHFATAEIFHPPILQLVPLSKK
jgi:hypothetical protein